MTGAIEFLRKAKAVSDDQDSPSTITFQIIDYLDGVSNALSEADLVRKVMDYRLEDKDAN